MGRDDDSNIAATHLFGLGNFAENLDHHFAHGGMQMRIGFVQEHRVDAIAPNVHPYCPDDEFDDHLFSRRQCVVCYDLTLFPLKDHLAFAGSVRRERIEHLEIVEIVFAKQAVDRLEGSFRITHLRDFGFTGFFGQFNIPTIPLLLFLLDESGEVIDFGQ